jgi:acyl-CoA thioester hydrolase
VSQLADFPYSRAISLRWKDNDVYGHVNNVEYYSFFDTVINEYLILEAGMDIHRGEAFGVCAESHCAFTASVEYPGTIVAGLRVEHLGSKSVRYGIGLFEPAGAELATGWFVHVFVERESRRPVAIPDGVRTKLAELVT